MKFIDNKSIRSLRTQKDISKRLLLTNETTEAQGVVKSNNPLFLKNSGLTSMNPDIRYQSIYQNNALNTINFRNALLMFAENAEIDKALRIYANEIVVTNIKNKKYPVNPVLNDVLLEKDKLELAKTIQEYMDKVFFPKLWRWYGFHENGGLNKLVKEYMTTGKLAFEKVYDNLKRPKDIVNIYPIDPSCLQKFRQDFQTWYLYNDYTNHTERVLHESQVILIEYNEYDFGYISYVDKVRRSFNIMRGMQTAKIGWFAAKSQVRLHINFAMGDMARTDAEQALNNERSQIMTEYEFDEVNGIMYFNGEPTTMSYQEYITAESQNAGKAEIEEVIGNGPDLTEVDSLQYWEKKYWADWEIPYDRVDPSSAETWSFSEPSSVKKSEINFSKNCLDIKQTLDKLFLDPIITQLTLKEAEIGVDLSLLDSISMNWVTFNEYEGPAELEMLSKRIETAQSLSTFGEAEDKEGRTRKLFPAEWIMDNFLDFTPEQKASLDKYRILEDIKLGYLDKNGNPVPEEDEESEDLEEDELFNFDDSDEGDDAESIMEHDNSEY